MTKHYIIINFNKTCTIKLYIVRPYIIKPYPTIKLFLYGNELSNGK